MCSSSPISRFFQRALLLWNGARCSVILIILEVAVFHLFMFVVFRLWFNYCQFFHLKDLINFYIWCNNKFPLFHLMHNEYTMRICISYLRDRRYYACRCILKYIPYHDWYNSVFFSIALYCNCIICVFFFL